MVDDGIDMTQWLPRDVSVVNPFREAKGDLDGRVEGEGKLRRITHAKIKSRTLLDWLIGAEVIDQTHEYFAMGFLELQHCFLSETRYKSNSIFLAQALGGTDSGKHADTLYLIVCNILKGPRVAIIHRASSSPALPDNYTMPLADKARFRDAFCALVDAMEEGIELLKHRLEEGEQIADR